MDDLIVPIVSVNIGQQEELGTRNDRKVYSGIHKLPLIGGGDIYLDKEGLHGDIQVDERVIRGKRVHGGPLKALYVLPRDHYAQWALELGRPLAPGAFGENVTVDDVTEADVRIDERWVWGDALLRVTGPRRPCYKLDMHLGEGTAQAMMANGRCGWYFEVLEPGMVPTSGSMQVVHRPPDGATVLEVFREKVRLDSTIPDMPLDA